MSEATKKVYHQTFPLVEPSISIPLHEIRGISVKEYHRMGEIGILSPDEPVELIDGVIRKMNPIGTKHAAVVNKLTNLLPRFVGTQAWISVQNPIVLNDDTEPEPDVALVKLRDDAYATAHPQPEDVLLVVEVSDTSLEYDLTEKLPRYAASGIPEVWLVDLVNNILEVYREPISQPNGTAAYRQRTNYYAGDTIELLMFPDIKLDVAQIL